MKIAIDARLYGLENAGLGRYLMNLITELALLDKKNDYSILLREKYYKSLMLPGNFTKVCVDIHHYTLSEQLRIPKILRQLDPDITHFPHFNVPINFKETYVVTIHDLLILNQNRSATTQRLHIYLAKRFAVKRVLSNAIRNCSKIIVPSKFVKSEILKYYKVPESKIVITYEGCTDLSINHNNHRSVLKKYNLTSPYFIYTGSAYPHKNLELAIEAFLDVNQHSRVEFAIVCSRNIFTKRLEKFVSRFDSDKRIRLLGFVPDEDLAILYKNSLAFIFPSISEGFGLTGLEAMGAGTVLMASDIPVFREIYTKHAIYFNPYRIDEIKQSFVKCLDISTSQRIKIIQDAKKFVEKYTWRKMAGETLEVYKNEGSNSLR